MHCVCFGEGCMKLWKSRNSADFDLWSSDAFVMKLNQLLYYELVPYIGSYSIISKNVPMRDKTLKLVDFDVNGFIA